VTSLNIGCLSVPYQSSSFIKWELLAGMPPIRTKAHLKHLRWSEPLKIRIDGRIGEALIILP
jgi:hypothetical protein